MTMYVRVTVKAGAKKESIAECGEAELGIAVREPAERNMANRRVVALVAEHFSVRPGAVRIISGHHSTRKILSVENNAV